MANYTPTFTKPYPSGWVDKPSKTTPATAAIMNSYDTAIAALEAYLRDNAIKNVSANTTVKSGTKIATITIDGTEYVLYSPSVSYESAITGGTKVGTITVGKNTFDVYAPASSAGGSTVSVVPKTLTGTNIAEITVDGTTYQLYAPTSGSSGSTVTAEATLIEGTQIGKITIDGVETILYAPTASPITVDSELSATSINPVQNKAIAEEFQKYANGTKVVAKATEANTATTASNSEKVNGHTVGSDVPSNAVFTDTVYDDSAVKASIQNIVNGTTQVGSATKATQDAQGNVIDTTYAKKTEVPQGTVVDDALSSTSTNPVQNKVVKAELDKVNSNLDTLEYSDVAGGKNLFDKNSSENVDGWLINGIPNGENTYNQKTSHFIRIDGNTFVYNKGNVNNQIAFYDSNRAFINQIHQNDGTNIVEIPTNAKYVRVVYFDGEKDLVQIEKGTTATDYEPYIPSVKMLAEENAQQNDSLSVLGKCKNLLKSTLQTTTQNGVTCTNNGDGTYTLNGTANANTQFEIKARGVISKQIRLVGCPMGGSNTSYNIVVVNYNGSDIRDNGNGITIPTNTECAIRIYVESDTTLSNKVFKPMLTTNLNATYDDFVPYTGEGDTLAEDVAELKNDLDGLGYGDNGVKNLFEDEIKWMENITVERGTKSVSDGKITLTATSYDCYTDHNVSSWKNNGIKTIPCKPNTKYIFSWEYEGDATGNVYIFENGSKNNMKYTINKAHKLTITTSADAEYLIVRVGVDNPGTSITYWNLQLEEGDTATEYKPYIPSVKMLAEEVKAQNESLGVIGKCKNLLKTNVSGGNINGVSVVRNNDGTFTLNGTSGSEWGFLNLNYVNGTTKSVPEGKWRLVGTVKNAFLELMLNNSSYGKENGNGLDFEVKSSDTNSWIRIYIPPNKSFTNDILKPMLVDATKTPHVTYDDFVPYTGDGDTLTADVADIKNDLDKLNSLPKGTIIQIEADKDTINTTKEKYGWQYLGTSSIEYDNGSFVSMATNVYRKNN